MATPKRVFCCNAAAVKSEVEKPSDIKKEKNGLGGLASCRSLSEQFFKRSVLAMVPVLIS
jgi:hypothetical protein